MTKTERKPRPLIIERPERQNEIQRWGYRSVTAVAWVLWFYLVIPLISLLAWIVGLAFVYTVLLQGLDVNDLPEILLRYGIGISILTGTYLIWALYCYVRFIDQHRRKSRQLATLDQLAEIHDLPGSEVQRWQTAGRYTVSTQLLEQMVARSREPGKPPATENVS